MQASLQKKIQKEDQLMLQRKRLFKSQVSVRRKLEYVCMRMKYS
jgi:hypothetical protein